MNRFVLVAVVWLLCVGSVWGYMHLRDEAHPSATARKVYVLQQAPDRYDLEVTLTFSTQPDPFALEGDETRAGTVLLNGTPVADLTNDILPGVPWVQRDIAGVAAGANELLLTATPPLADSARSHAVRVRLLRSGQAFAEKTFWSAGGAAIVGTLHFDASSEEETHPHE
ncbi:MAG: hypothetical protein AB7D51_03530 [Desulfovibrionaceae bacterium]